MRINKYLASAGVCSRREADRLIHEGLVYINGQLAELGSEVNPGQDTVKVDGRTIQQSETVYLKFNKPLGCLTSYGDDAGRRNLDEFPELADEKLPYSGRLDYDSSGLIIFSNDGELIYRLQRPEYRIEKEYYVLTDRRLTKAMCREMEQGLVTEDTAYLPCVVKEHKERGYVVVITEGKNRQVRRMFEHFGVNVTKLLRVRIGPIHLDKLRHGQIAELTEEEIKELKRCTGLK